MKLYYRPKRLQWDDLSEVDDFVTYKDGLVTVAVQEEDGSYRYRALMEKTQLLLKFSLPFYVDFPVGTWCDYMNQRFILGCPANLKKHGSRNYEYMLEMGTLEDGMADYKLHNTVDERLKWSMCAKPKEFIKEIVKNLNERDGAGVWSVGDCIDAPEKTIEFNHSYIDEALQSVAETFDTEFEVSEGFCISLHKVEYFKTDPLALSYGRGNGFIPGVGRTSVADEKPIKRLYTEGTDRNIDRSTYGSPELRLPKNKTLMYDGSKYEGEPGFNKEGMARSYISDDAGTYIERHDTVNVDAVKEDSLDCSEIYPSRVGEVSKLISYNPEKNLYNFTDIKIPDNLDFNQYLIAGENMTIIFQSGMLAGKEFDVTYKHAGKMWEIVPQEFDGVMMPNETFKPKSAKDDPENPDTYAVFGIQLPQEYICNNADKTGASWDMFREAARYLYEHEQQKFTFTGELQGMWAKRNWMRVGGHLCVGGYVFFTDNQFAKEGILIRITGIKDFLTAPYSPQIEISNTVSGSSSTSKSLHNIEPLEVVIEDTEKRMKQFTKRRFRDAKETIGMLNDSLLSNFSNAISPITIQTMSMLVGDESLQFQFVVPYDVDNADGSTTQKWRKVADTITYQDKRLHIDHCYIEHLTLDIDTVKPNRDNEEYKHWEMAEYESPVLNNPEKRYYLYAAVNKETPQGYFVLSSKAIPFDGGTGNNGDTDIFPYNYYLLTGILNSEYNGERSFVTLYGFTEILPGRITTGSIVSADGSCYFDLDNNEIGGVIKFLSNNGYVTLIDGGYINTQLINASELIANHIIAGDPNGRRVEITPDNRAVEIFDEKGSQCTILEGKSYSDASTFFDGKSGNVTIKGRSSSKWGYNSGVTYGRGDTGKIESQLNVKTEKTEEQIISEVFDTISPTEIALRGYCDLYANSHFNKTQSNVNLANPQSNAKVYFIVRCRTFAEKECIRQIASHDLYYGIASANASAAAGDPNIPDTWVSQSNSNKEISTFVKVPAGHHRLSIVIYYSASGGVGNYIQCNWGFTSGARDDISASYKSDSYVSRYFANGFCLGTRVDNYIWGYKDGDNGMRFKFANSGNEVDFSHEGLKYRINGGSWKSLT